MTGMLIWWARRPRRKKVGSGVFDCGYCKAQQSCDFYQVGVYLYVYSIPISEEERLGEFVVCDGCNQEFPSASYREPTGSSATQPVTWKCPRCEAVNPNHTYRCEACHYSLV
jgi:hypothetical protein